VLPSLAKATEAAAIVSADSLLDKIQALEKDARRVGKAAEDALDFRAAIAAIRELVRIVELQAKLAGQLQEGQTINLVVMPEWISLRTTILLALEPYPEARLALANALPRGAG
jgi:hypothetical protein